MKCECGAMKMFYNVIHACPVNTHQLHKHNATHGGHYAHALKHSPVRTHEGRMVHASAETIFHQHKCHSPKPFSSV